MRKVNVIRKERPVCFVGFDMPRNSETPTGSIYVLYRLGGEHFDPPHIADLIGITPTEMHRNEPDGRNKGYGWLDIDASFDAGDLRKLPAADQWRYHGVPQTLTAVVVDSV